MTDGTIKVLYNDCYGGFNLSQKFLAEYERRAKKPVEFASLSFRVGPNSIRTDPVAIAIWEEFGSEWCSGPDSAIECFEIPAIFARYWEIEDYEGDETVHVGLDTALADCLHTYMETRDLATLTRTYGALMEAHRRLQESPPEPSLPAAPRLLKTPPQIDVTTPPHDSCCTGGTRSPCAGCP